MKIHHPTVHTAPIKRTFLGSLQQICTSISSELAVVIKGCCPTKHHERQRGGAFRPLAIAVFPPDPPTVGKNTTHQISTVSLAHRHGLSPAPLLESPRPPLRNVCLRGTSHSPASPWVACFGSILISVRLSPKRLSFSKENILGTFLTLFGYNNTCPRYHLSRDYIFCVLSFFVRGRRRSTWEAKQARSFGELDRGTKERRTSQSDSCTHKESF